MKKRIQTLDEYINEQECLNESKSINDWVKELNNQDFINDVKKKGKKIFFTMDVDIETGEDYQEDTIDCVIEFDPKSDTLYLGTADGDSEADVSFDDMESDLLSFGSGVVRYANENEINENVRGDRTSPLVDYKEAIDMGEYWRPGRIIFTWGDKNNLNNSPGEFRREMIEPKNIVYVGEISSGIKTPLEVPGVNIAQFLCNSKAMERFARDFEKMKITFDEFRAEFDWSHDDYTKKGPIRKSLIKLFQKHGKKL